MRNTPLLALFEDYAECPGAQCYTLPRNNTWARFGQRDPSLLITATGLPVLDDEKRYTLFFNARDKDPRQGGITCVGVAKGTPMSGWTLHHLPAFADFHYAAQGSIILLKDRTLRLYYSNNTSQGFKMVSSENGFDWTTPPQSFLLAPRDFGVTRIGLPFVCWVDNQWTMVFEGLHNGIFHIYRAISDDGLNWQPAESGQPIYKPGAASWDSYGQANPSIYVEHMANGEPRYFILYNGCSVEYGWDIGLLMSKSLDGPWQARSKPVLKRGEAGAWNSGRLEGARIFAEAPNNYWITYFGLPGEDSYRNGEIVFAPLCFTKASN